MRTLIILALCAAPALAQPVVKPRPIAPQTTGIVRLQILSDLQALTKALYQPNASFAALLYIYGARDGYYGSNEWAANFGANYIGRIRLKDVQILEYKGNDATAKIIYSFDASPRSSTKKGQAQVKEQQETLKFKFLGDPLQSEKQTWQIVPPETKPPAINAENNGVLWANVAYHIAQKEPLELTGTPVERSMSNLKQLAYSVFQFTQDYDESYAFTPRYLIEAISPYVSNKTIFQVPNSNEIYAFNGNLSGLTIHQVKSSGKTVLFYEGQNEKPIFRYDGKAAICFADGHVALVTPDEAQKLIWKP